MAKRKRNDSADTTQDPPRPRTRAAKRHAHSPGVLNNPEMLALVLQRVPMIDLFVLQRVNTFWYDTINKTPELQIKMFLRPSGPALAPDPTIAGPTYRQEIKVNPAAGLLHRDAAENSGGAHKDVSRTRKADFAMTEVTTGENTRLFFVPSRKNYPFGAGRKACPINYSNASWRKMLVTQPPVQAVRFADWSTWGPEKLLAFVRDKAGVTWGGLSSESREHNRVGGAISRSARFDISVRFPEDSEVLHAIKGCTGKADWGGLCGCLWLMQEEAADYEGFFKGLK